MPSVLLFQLFSFPILRIVCLTLHTSIFIPFSCKDGKGFDRSFPPPPPLNLCNIGQLPVQAYRPALLPPCGLLSFGFVVSIFPLQTPFLNGGVILFICLNAFSAFGRIILFTPLEFVLPISLSPNSTLLKWDIHTRVSRLGI